MCIFCLYERQIESNIILLFFLVLDEGGVEGKMQCRSLWCEKFPERANAKSMQIISSHLRCCYACLINVQAWAFQSSCEVLYSPKKHTKCVRQHNILCIRRSQSQKQRSRLKLVILLWSFPDFRFKGVNINPQLTGFLECSILPKFTANRWVFRLTVSCVTQFRNELFHNNNKKIDRRSGHKSIFLPFERQCQSRKSPWFDGFGICGM